MKGNKPNGVSPLWIVLVSLIALAAIAGILISFHPAAAPVILTITTFVEAVTVVVVRLIGTS
jgi:hypothetical protein